MGVKQTPFIFWYDGEMARNLDVIFKLQRLTKKKNEALRDSLEISALLLEGLYADLDNIGNKWEVKQKIKMLLGKV